MNFQKYANNGWGLSRKALYELYWIVRIGDRVLEFGSGKSTEFLLDLNRDLQITSFDHDPSYAFKSDIVNIRPLVETSDYWVDYMFEKKEYNRTFMDLKVDKPSTRQRNCFYDLKPYDIHGIYDVVILDGPNGNGRSLAALILKDNLEKGSIVLIDDFRDYDFLDYFSIVFDFNILSMCSAGKRKQWNKGGDFVIIEINEKL